MAKQFPKVLYVAIEEDGDESYFLNDESLMGLANEEPRPVAVYKLVETGVVRDMRICKYRADR